MVQVDPVLLPLVLASASPRRHDLLGRLGVAFSIDPADVDETPRPGMAPREIAEELACRKASAVAARHPAATVIGSDTIVALGSRLLGKPADADDARATLRALSASTHEVITGVALIHVATGELASAAGVTAVTMRPLSDEDIDAYVSTGDCFDKAGAYGIQEGADSFVTRLDGAYDNVVGFPTAVFVRLAGELAARVARATGAERS